MKTEWTTKNISIAGGLGISALLILPNLGKGWEALRYLADTPPTAYAAKQQAEAVDAEFDRYLAEQRKLAETQQAVADALNAYVGQQQQQATPRMRNLPNPAPPAIWFERAEDGSLYCTNGETWWWPTEQGDCE